jgi:ribosome recycling factor
MEKDILRDLDAVLRRASAHLATEFGTLHAGKATVSMVDSVAIEVHGVTAQLREMAAITTPDARTIAILPWDRGTAKAIEKGILAANIGFTPIIDADRIRCIVPELSRERRQELAKRAAAMAETARVSVRAGRRDAVESLRAAQKKGKISEDDLKRGEKEIQKVVDAQVERINGQLTAKEKELLGH